MHKRSIPRLSVSVSIRKAFSAAQGKPMTFFVFASTYGKYEILNEREFWLFLREWGLYLQMAT